jgi:hypothetical protein
VTSLVVVLAAAVAVAETARMNVLRADDDEMEDNMRMSCWE